jgi:hypothetical protein
MGDGTWGHGILSWTTGGVVEQRECSAVDRHRRPALDGRRRCCQGGTLDGDTGSTMLQQRRQTDELVTPRPTVSLCG